MKMFATEVNSPVDQWIMIIISNVLRLRYSRVCSLHNYDPYLSPYHSYIRPLVFDIFIHSIYLSFDTIKSLFYNKNIV